MKTFATVSWPALVARATPKAASADCTKGGGAWDGMGWDGGEVTVGEWDGPSDVGREFVVGNTVHPEQQKGQAAAETAQPTATAAPAAKQRYPFRPLSPGRLTRGVMQ